MSTVAVFSNTLNCLQCSTSCGQGIQLREVFCKVNAPTRGMIIVDDSNCNAVERPEKELVCNVHNPCPGDGKFLFLSTEFTPSLPRVYPEFTIKGTHSQHVAKILIAFRSNYIFHLCITIRCFRASGSKFMLHLGKAEYIFDCNFISYDPLGICNDFLDSNQRWLAF